MRVLTCIAVLVLAACQPAQMSNNATYKHERQQPSVTQPGVSVSGYVNIGVRKRF